ncbi:MAG: hypothetical protein LQ350_007772 [Teloschistes chrysophthalmus]|nr:MAG: hypothetical protein LQ350_007772 [Niorma chrysophthalma]
MTDYMQRDGDTLRYNTADRCYTFTPDVFIKRQAKAHEIRYRQMDGKVVEHAFNRQRIENERDAITFISKNTSIPVPRLLEWSEEDGVGCLTFEALKGETFGSLYWDLDPEGRERVGKNLMTFITEVLLPELRRLRSKTMGQLSGIVFPPPRVTSYDERAEWQSRTSSTDRYVYCHNDLDFHNFMIDKEA